MEAQVSLTVAFSSSAFFGLLFLIFFLTIPHRFSMAAVLNSSPQILESILLVNPHKAAVLSVGCASFSSTLFPSPQLSVNMLDTALCEQPASLAMNVCGLPSL